MVERIGQFRCATVSLGHFLERRPSTGDIASVELKVKIGELSESRIVIRRDHLYFHRRVTAGIFSSNMHENSFPALEDVAS
jgi:hypothetical protein